MFILPEWIVILLKFTIFIVSIIVFIHLIFYTLLSYVGLKKPKRDYELVSDQKKFLFIIPAHNEEAVIGQCLASLRKLNYAKELYEVVVLVDHSDDNTEQEVAKFSEVYSFVNRYEEGESRGKPHVIGKYLATLKEQWQAVDYIVLLDADNLTSANFLTELNSQFLSNPEYVLIQGYLDSKNIGSSLMSRGYAAAYYMTNRSIQYAKHQMNWNASVGGTGFALATDYLEEYGWNPRSYTEDFEIQVELSIEGRQTGWNHFAKIYDEKPNTFKASHVQRTRWSQGHWLIAFSKTKDQIKSLFEKQSLERRLNRFETLVYSYSMLRAVWLFFLVILVIIDNRFMEDFPDFISFFYFWVFFEVSNYFLFPTVYIIQEGKAYLNNFKGLGKVKEFLLLWIGYFYSTSLYYVAQVQGFFSWFFPQTIWKKTAHSQEMDYEDFDSE